MLKYSIAIYFLLFIIYAMMGWVMEVTCKSIEAKKFVNRGFLIGPYCPIYGWGAIFITILLQKYTDDWIILFLMSIITCGILEYLTSYVMEKIFHARWWDYSKRKYNINGRVCLETLIPFGILGLVVMYVTNPFIIRILQSIPENIIHIISIILLALFLIDSIISLKIVSNVRSTSSKLNKENLKDNTEEITAKVKEILRSRSILNRRLINAYPDLQARIKQKKEQIKEKTEAVKQDIKKRKNK